MPAVHDVAVLASIPLFRGLSEEHLLQVNQRLRRTAFGSGATVVSYDGPGEILYIVLSGTVKVKVDQPDGSEVIIALLGPGELIGELSLLDNTVRSADVVTQEESLLLWLDRAAFEALLQDMPRVSRNLLSILSRRLRNATEQIQALCTLDVCGKVTRQLLVFAEQCGVKTEAGVRIPLRLTQSDMAGLIGASRERVNQVFVGLRHRQLISVDSAYRVTVRDMARMREMLERR